MAKLTMKLLEDLVKEEMKLLGGAKKPEDVKAKEVDADELGTDKALEEPEKRTHNVDESVKQIKSLNVEEKRLIEQLRKVRARKVQCAKRLIDGK